MQWGQVKTDLQHQRHQEGDRACRDAKQRAGDDGASKRAVCKDRQRQDGRRRAPGVANIGYRCAKPDQRCGNADDRRQGGQADHRKAEDDAACRECRKGKAGDIQRRRSLGLHVGQENAGKPVPDNADRHIDQKNPVP